MNFVLSFVSIPQTRTLPELGSVIPAISLARVDLPEPFFPIILITSPLFYF